ERAVSARSVAAGASDAGATATLPASGRRSSAPITTSAPTATTTTEARILGRREPRTRAGAKNAPSSRAAGSERSSIVLIAPGPSATSPEVDEDVLGLRVHVDRG